MNFDRVAHIYDATRSLPPEAAQRVMERVLAATGAGETTRFLEIGIGTGRIAAPFITHGYQYSGVDISRAMMAQLRKKFPGKNLNTLQADVTALPFGDASFEVVLAVHILHLVPEWRKAVDEAFRVLVPGGFFVQGSNVHGENSPDEIIRRRWGALVQEIGGPERERSTDAEEVEDDLIARGCRIAVYRVARWTDETRPIDLIGALYDRNFSHTWDIPQEIMDPAHDRLLAWAREEYGDLEAPVPGDHGFILSVARVP